MQKVFSILAVTCLLFSCSKENRLRPKNDAQLATTGGTCEIQSVSGPYYATSPTSGTNFNFFKTYDPWEGYLDSVAINLYGPYNLNGHVKKEDNWVYIVGANPGDTLFRAELNSQGQVLRTQHDHLGPMPWCYFTYNNAGQLIRFHSDNSGSDDYSLIYDSLGNVSRIIQALDTSRNITFTYDYATPITGSDYVMEYYFAVMNDLEICIRLNLLELPRHFKLTHTTSTLYPEMDIYYTNQFIDNYGRLIYYEANAQSYTINWHCI